MKVGDSFIYSGSLAQFCGAVLSDLHVSCLVCVNGVWSLILQSVRTLLLSSNLNCDLSGPRVRVSVSFSNKQNLWGVTAMYEWEATSGACCVVGKRKWWRAEKMSWLFCRNCVSCQRAPYNPMCFEGILIIIILVIVYQQTQLTY